jgi:hypothetical protein
MGKLCSALVVGALTVATGFGVAACGSSSNSDNSGGKGGTAKIGSVLPDSYDPSCCRPTRATRRCSSSTPAC